MYFVYYNDRHPPAEKPSCKIRHTHSSCAQTLDYLIKHLDSPLLDESARRCPCRPRHKSLESSELFRCSIFQRLSQSSLNIPSLRNFDGRIYWSLCELGVSSEKFCRVRYLYPQTVGKKIRKTVFHAHVEHVANAVVIWTTSRSGRLPGQRKKRRHSSFVF